MKILSLLGKRLKDDEIIELLDAMDVEVTYEFDRSHENTADAYWAQAKDHGLTLRFDEEQRLDTAFIYLKPIDGNTPLDPSALEDVAIFDSPAEVEAYGQAHGITVRRGTRPKALPPPGVWIRLDYDTHRAHYDFRKDELHIITVSPADAAQTT